MEFFFRHEMLSMAFNFFDFGSNKAFKFNQHSIEHLIAIFLGEVDSRLPDRLFPIHQLHLEDENFIFGEK